MLLTQHVAYASYECREILSPTVDELVNKMERIEEKKATKYLTNPRETLWKFSKRCLPLLLLLLPHSNSFFIQRFYSKRHPPATPRQNISSSFLLLYCHKILLLCTEREADLLNLVTPLIMTFIYMDGPWLLLQVVSCY